MFLWARLVLDLLSSQVFDAEGMKAAVNEIPSELHTLYVFHPHPKRFHL